MSAYYVAEGERTLGPMLVGEIQDLWRRGEITAAALVCAEGAEDWCELESILPQPGVVVEQNAAPRASIYLDEIRQNSCYAMLRSVITVVCAIVGVLLGGASLALLIGSLGRINEEGLAAVPLALICAGVGFVLVVAGWQAAMILIDIADVQLDQGRRTRNRN